MPRSKRRTATLGEGISTSTGTSRSVTHGISTLRTVRFDRCVCVCSDKSYKTVMKTANHSSCALSKA